MKIGIAGVGGIGSNVALNLVRLGVSELTLVDFDRVEPSNLNRQFYFKDQVGMAKVEMLARNLQRIDPDVTLHLYNTKINNDNISTLFEECDIIVEGFDRVEDKKMLVEHFAQGRKLIVSASGIAGRSLETIVTKKIGDCYLVGDFCSDVHNNKLFGFKVVAVAARMSEIVYTCGDYHEQQ